MQCHDCDGLSGLGTARCDSLSVGAACARAAARVAACALRAHVAAQPSVGRGRAGAPAAREPERQLGPQACIPALPDPPPMSSFRGAPLTHETAEAIFIGYATVPYLAAPPTAAGRGPGACAARAAQRAGVSRDVCP